MLEKGFPREGEWPKGLSAALEGLLQGDIVERPPFFYFADPNNGIWIDSRRYSETSTGPEVVVGQETELRYGMITTQTCDLVEEGVPKRPWVQVAPVLDLTRDYRPQKRILIERGLTTYLVHVPGLDGFWVADLRIEFPIEKGWLIGHRPIRGFPTLSQQRELADRLGFIRQRVPFGESFVTLIQRPLAASLSGLKATAPELLALYIESVDEIAADTDDPLNPVVVGLVVISRVEVAQALRDWLSVWWEGQRPIASAGGITLLNFTFASYETMTAAEYRRLHRLGDLIAVERV